MGIMRNAFRHTRRLFMVKTSTPLIRDFDGPFPRLIYKTRIRGRTVIWKKSGHEREDTARKIASEVIPREGKYFSFQLSKRYPRIPTQKRFEKYYDLPSLKDIYDGKMNRRLKKLLRENKISFNELLNICMKGYNEMQGLKVEYMQRDGYENTLDFGPDQFMVNLKNGKPHFIMIDI
jgi:hypothetical protein